MVRGELTGCWRMADRMIGGAGMVPNYLGPKKKHGLNGSVRWTRHSSDTRGKVYGFMYWLHAGTRQVSGAHTL